MEASCVQFIDILSGLPKLSIFLPYLHIFYLSLSANFNGFVLGMSSYRPGP